MHTRIPYFCPCVTLQGQARWEPLKCHHELANGNHGPDFMVRRLQEATLTNHYSPSLRTYYRSVQTRLSKKYTIMRERWA